MTLFILQYTGARGRGSIEGGPRDAVNTAVCGDTHRRVCVSMCVFADGFRPSVVLVSPNNLPVSVAAVCLSACPHLAVLLEDLGQVLLDRRLHLCGEVLQP